MSRSIFCRWLEVAGLSLGSVVQRWWEREPPVDPGSLTDGKRSWDEGSVDLYMRIAGDLEADSVSVTDGLPIIALMAWLSAKLGENFNHRGSTDADVLLDEARFEFAILEDLDGDVGVRCTGAMEATDGGHDPEQESFEIAENIVYGWPKVDQDPTQRMSPGRFVKSFPLKFPMGVGDLRDPQRRHKVTGPEWLQHLLRYNNGWMTSGGDGSRLLWAMVNTILLEEAAGKGFAVHRNVVRRLGGRVVGGGVLTKDALRKLLKGEDEAARSVTGALVYNLQSVGRSVRSTTMQWSAESKKLDCAVKTIGSRPVWGSNRQQANLPIQL